MGFFKKALNAIKNWVTGGSSKSSKSNKSSKSSSGSSKSSRSSSSGSSYSSSGSYYGGGTRKAFKAQLDEEERKRKQKEQQLKNAFKANASMSSSSSSSSSSSEKKTPPDPKQQAFKASQKRITKKLSEIEAKQTEDPKEALRRKAMQKREAEKASYYKATKNKFNPETGNKAHDSEARRRIRSGDYQTDADAAKWEYKAHPKEEARKRVQQNTAANLKKISNKTSKALTVKSSKEMVKSGDYEYRPKAKNMNTPSSDNRSSTRLTLQGYKKRMSNPAFNAAQSGAREFVGSAIFLEPLMRGDKNDKTERAIEKYYQENKNKLAAGVGSLAGALVPYGGTAKAFESMGARAVERAAATQAGRRLGAEALRRTMAGKGAKAALTRSLVGDAIQDSTLGLFDTAVNASARDDLKTARDYARAIAEGQAINYGVGLMGNAVAHGAPMARRAWNDFADESRKLRFVPKGVDMLGDFGNVTDAGRRLIMNGGTTRTSRLNGIQFDNGFQPKKLGRKANKLDDLIRAKRAGSVASNALAPPKLGEALDDTIARRATRTAEQNAVERQMPQMRNAMRETFTGNADNARRVDMNDILAQNSPFRQADEAVRPQNVENVAPPQTPRQAGQAYQYPDTETYIRELDEKGEQWLGQYGHITDNGDGTYNLFRNGEGDRTLSREEATDYIARSRDALQREELARAERERVTRTTPLNEAENARLAEIDDEVARLGTESNADAAELRSNRYNGLDDYQARQAERARNERNLINERDNIIRKEPERPLTDAEIERNALQEEYDELAELHRTASADGSMSPVELQQTLDDMQELNMMIRDLDAQISRERASVEAPRATEQAPNINEENAPRTDLVPRKEASRAKTENTRAGERTEFRRNNEETAKEQARNKRTTNNRKGATQETFDKDFDTFERKVSESQSKAEDLRKKIRSASSEEEKAALKKQLDELNSEIRREFNKASMRYHPDRGGSNEWMRQFNDVYDSYKRGSYKSRRFSGAESSQRASTGARAKAKERYRAQSAGGNGNTPPPPRGGTTEAGERGFKKPKGKAAAPKEQRTVYNVEDLVNKKRQRTSNREKLKGAYHETKRKVVNSMASFEDVNLKNVKSNPEKWSVNNAAVDKTRRHGAIAGRSIREGQLQVNGKRFSGTVERVGADGKRYKIENGKSLMQIYDGMDEKTESAFDAYLLLKHAPDRIREGTPIFDRIKLASNESLNDINVINREADRLLKEHPEFAEKAEEIYQYTQNELENRVRAGLLSQETASKWMHDHPFYVPTGRDGYFNAVHGNHKGVIGADPIKAAKGSDLDIRSIKEQLADATNRNWRDITTNNLLEKYFGDAVKTDTPVDDGLELLNNTIGLSKSADGRKFYAKIFRNGDMHRVEIDKRFYDDLDDLYKNGSIGPISDTIASASSKFSGLFKKLVTSWNPFFMPKNFSRDIQDAIINTRQTKEFFESLGPAAKELSNDGEFLRAFRDSGVSQANLVNLDESLTNGKGGVFGKALDGFATLNEAVETWPRLAEFMATIKKAGYKKLDDIPPEKYTDLIDTAAANAADVTVNFARSGSVGKNLNKGLVPFFNPSVQGWSKFVRNFREQRGLKQMLGTIAKASMLGAGTVWINNTCLEDNPNYQQLSARDKATNYIIPWVWGNDRTVDNTDTFIKIPRGRFAAVYGLSTVNAKNENEMGWAEMVKVGKDQIAPVDPLESSIYAPFLLAKKNETWYGSPIVPESIKNDTHPSEEYDQNTSYLGRALGKATENLPKELQISPKKADYIIDAESGIIGDVLLPALTPSRQGGGKGVIGKAGPAVLNVAKRQFTIDSTTQNDLSSRFYDKVQTTSDNKKSAKATDKDAAEYKRMNAYSSEVSKLTTAIRDLQGSNKATKQEDIRGLQEVRNKLMQDALDGKKPPSTAKAMDAVQKYVGTSYAIDKFGSSTDKEAMKVYGASVYGNISEKEMQKKIDADKDFYKGVRAVGKLEDKLAKATGSKATSALSRSVALAEVGASDELFGAYEGTKKSRTETDIKMNRARNYISDGGSSDEFIKLEKTRKTLGKLSDYDKEAELDKALADLKSNQISEAEYYQRQGEINYNANISYVGLATSLAQANSPSRGYVLYDIKAKNVQKGINLAAMGFTARDYREMAKAVDADGNGYPKKQEIIDYVNSRDDIEDKATLYDALYYYKSSRNPFGAPTKYSRDDAAATGKKNGVEQISDETGDLKLKDDEESKSGYGYRRRGYRRWRRWGRRGGKAKTPALRTDSAYKAKAKLPNAKKSSSSSASSKAPTVKRSYKSMAPSARTSKSTNVNMRGLKLTPPTPKKGGKKS